MECLTKAEIAKWINIRGALQDPYSGESEPEFRVKSSAPSTYFAIEYFVRAIMREIFTEGELLVEITDRSPSEESRDFVFDSIGSNFTDEFTIERFPGFSLEHNESERAVALFSVVTCFKWKCYLYGSNHQLVLHNWEGDIFDFWTSSPTMRDKYRILSKSFDLKEIT
jgi:hypothetical protein